MKNIWSVIENIVLRQENSDPEEYDLIDDIENSGEDINERLERAGISYEDAAAAAEGELRRLRKAAEGRFGTDKLDTPYIWIELIKLCDGGETEKVIDLILWLLTYESFICKELDEAELIGTWLDYEEKRGYLNGLKTDIARFAEILEKLEYADLSDGAENVEYEIVFSMLTEKGYADGRKNAAILKNNLAEISARLSAADFLDPIKPLAYYGLLVNYKKKMQQKDGFTPDIRKAFTPISYKIDVDNGKNYGEHALKCALYSDLKKCFPNSDKKLCDAGFICLYKLAEWYRRLGFEGYDCTEPDYDIPFVPSYFVYSGFPVCFGDFPYDDVGAYADSFPLWEKKYPLLLNAARRAVSDIRFDELEAFAEDPRGFVCRLQSDEFMRFVTQDNFGAARGFLIKAAVERFDELLAEKLTEILNGYFFKNPLERSEIP